VKHYDDFDLNKGPLTARELTGFKDKYAALRDSIVMQSKDKESILGDIDFKMELLQTDVINVDYIISLIGRIKVAAVDKREYMKQDLLMQVGADERYRSKLELIKKFIADHLDGLDENDNIDVAFTDYVQVEKERELNDIAVAYAINPEKLAYEVIKHTQADKKIDGATLIDLMAQRPSLFKLESVSEQLLQRVTNFINVFSWVA
jgi:type I restriction enzyme, R subunit